jgi:hypothetical protein
MDIIDIKQELPVAEQYTKIMVRGVVYYYNTYPGADGKTNLYDETLMTKNRKPVPVGRIEYENGKMRIGFFPKPGAAKDAAAAKDKK